MNEIISVRTENSKTYDLGGMERRAEISIGIIHYKDNYSDPNEQWKDIDLTWEGNKITKAPYILEVNNLGITFTSKKTGTVQTLSLDKIGSEISAKSVLWNFIGREARLENFATDTDVVIEAYSEGVRFKRILKTKNAPLSAEFIHSKIIGKADDITLRVSARDANEKPLEVIKSDRAGRITETLDSKIDLTKTKFPIEIDPEITIQPSGKDTYIDPNHATSNFGSGTYWWLGISVPDIFRAIFNFNASAVPAGSTINSATSSLFYANQLFGNMTGETIWTYKITRNDWVEAEATWNIYKTDSNWTTAGGDYVTSNPDGASITMPAGADVWIDWNVKAIVQDAVDNVSGSVNLIVKLATESGAERGGQSWFREYTTTSLRPKLVIDYTEGGAPPVQNAILFSTNF